MRPRTRPERVKPRTRPKKFFETEAEAEATMYEAKAEARHIREQLSVYEHERYCFNF